MFIESMVLGFVLVATMIIVLLGLIYPREISDALKFKCHNRIFDADFNMCLFMWLYLIIYIAGAIYLSV